jgi:hypothetical protein
MVINDFDIIRITALPDETDTPLLVYPDAVLTFPVMMQGLQMVGRRNSQGLNRTGSIQHQKFDYRSSLNVLRQFCGKLPVKQLLGFLAFEYLYHKTYYPEEILSSMDIMMLS